MPVNKAIRGTTYVAQNITHTKQASSVVLSPLRLLLSRAIRTFSAPFVSCRVCCRRSVFSVPVVGFPVICSSDPVAFRLCVALALVLQPVEGAAQCRQCIFPCRRLVSSVRLVHTFALPPCSCYFVRSRYTVQRALERLARGRGPGGASEGALSGLSVTRALFLRISSNGFLSMPQRPSLPLSFRHFILTPAVSAPLWLLSVLGSTHRLGSLPTAATIWWDVVRLYRAMPGGTCEKPPFLELCLRTACAAWSVRHFPLYPY